MGGEPLAIGAAKIFEGTGGLLHRRRHLSADGLPCISMGDGQGVKHVRFTGYDAPTRANNVIKEGLSTVQADVSLGEKLATPIADPSDQAAAQSGERSFSDP